MCISWLAANKKLHEFAIKAGVPASPQVVSRPMKYTPEDVNILAGFLLSQQSRIAEQLKIFSYPMETENFDNKNPTMVFKLETKIFNKLNFLSSEKQISPNEVYAQMERAVNDAKSLLRHVDPGSRYRIDAPKSAKGLKPKDVFAQCIIIRNEINKVRNLFNLGSINIPSYAAADNITPSDVFIQIQIIIAELNLLKMATNTFDSTPLPIPVSGKSPGDVHQKATLLHYLLSQIPEIPKLYGSKKAALSERE